MDFSLTTIFVVPPSNSLPSSGGPQDLAAKQFGVFDNKYAVATVGTIAAKPYIYLAQARPSNIPTLGTKVSDKISKLKVTEWYKVVAEPDKLNQITEVSNFTIPCGTSVSVTIRLHSNLIDSAYFNGLTRSVTVLTPCCDCDGDPCVDIDPQATVDLIAAKINEDDLLSKYVSAYRTGTGASSILRILGKDLPIFTNSGGDVNAFQFKNDRLWFRVFVYEAPATSQDDLVPDRCDAVATVLVKQRSSYPHGSADEIRILERRYFSYQAKNKHIYKSNEFNEYATEVVNGTYYDLFYIKYKLYEDDTWYTGALLDAACIIAVPTGEGGTLQTLLTAAFGAPTSYSATDVTTTTTTSTSSTTTTTTTVLQP